LSSNDVPTPAGGFAYLDFPIEAYASVISSLQCLLWVDRFPSQPAAVEQERTRRPFFVATLLEDIECRLNTKDAIKVQSKQCSKRSY
jgi:hypothetical protein